MEKKIALLGMLVLVLIGSFAMVNLVHRALKPVDAIVHATQQRPAKPLLVNAVAYLDTNRRAN